ncbi:MAG: hypothetical protein ACI9RU_002083 [Litorivivens sp.]|jgi:hypothetical protein
MSNAQTTDCVLMVRPASFRLNLETSVNNHFQQGADESVDVNAKAQKEFDLFVSMLEDNGIEVIVVQDTLEPSTPDALFPNNWVSFHVDKIAFLYPMFAPNRRAERREDIIEQLKKDHNFELEGIIDFTEFEEHQKYLEGTGSLVLDRESKICYAAISERTDRKAVAHFCMETGYKPVPFSAYHTVDGIEHLIYHTNVMMSVGANFAVVCLECIKEEKERDGLVSILEQTGHEVIPISLDQIDHFAGNILQLSNSKNESVIALSTRAKNCLSEDQIDRLETHGKLVYSDLTTIENYGGGSARCMIAEIFLPRAQNETN